MSGCSNRRLYLGGPSEELQDAYVVHSKDILKETLLSEKKSSRKLEPVGQNKGEVVQMLVVSGTNLLHWPQRSKTATNQSCHAAPIFAPNWYIKTVPRRLQEQHTQFVQISFVFPPKPQPNSSINKSLHHTF